MLESEELAVGWLDYRYSIVVVLLTSCTTLSTLMRSLKTTLFFVFAILCMILLFEKMLGRIQICRLTLLQGGLTSSRRGLAYILCSLLKSDVEPFPLCLFQNSRFYCTAASTAGLGAPSGNIDNI